MPGLIRSNSPDVSQRRPMLGLTVRTGGHPFFEVAVATRPELFRPEARAERAPSNFYTTRDLGPLAAERGEAVYLLPAEVLARFAGQERLYYAVATFPDASRSIADVRLPPVELAPYVTLSRSYTGRPMRSLVGNGTGRRRDGSGYGSEGSRMQLEWAGDAARPGAEPIAPAGPASGNGTPRVTTNGGGTPGPDGPAVPAAQALRYDDGFDASLWERSYEAVLPEADPDAYGIDGPEPEIGLVPGVPSLGAALQNPAFEYPGTSRFVSAGAGHFTRGTAGRAVRRIVIHITDGTTTEGTVGWFRSPENVVSSHYVIGQDGEVVQMVRHDDIAHHARGANRDSIGIEHVASVKYNLWPTEQEYCASAALVRWLADHYGIPCDRQHIVGHSEVGNTDHTACPQARWDWTHFMGLVQSGACYAPPPLSGSQGYSTAARAASPPLAAAPAGRAAAALAYAPAPEDAEVRTLGSQSVNFNWDDVELLGQPNNMACWATAASMVQGWRDRVCLEPREIARQAGLTAEYDSQAGIYPNQMRALAASLGMEPEPAQSYSIEGFIRLLQDYGPLWVSARTPMYHVIVVTGIMSDGGPSGSDTVVRIHDPWDRAPGSPGSPGPYRAGPGQGSRYLLRWDDFVRMYHDRITTEPDGTVNVQIIRCRDVTDRMPAIDSQYTFSYAYVRPSAGAVARAMVTPDDVIKAGVGALINKVVGSTEGDIKWELEQRKGIKHVRDDASNEGSGVYQRKVLKPEGMWYEVRPFADRITAGFEIAFDYNGRSLGNVTITQRRANDARGAALEVKATVMDDAHVYRSPGGDTMAAIRVHFHWRFTFTVGGDMIAHQNFILFGNGTYNLTEEWTQG